MLLSACGPCNRERFFVRPVSQKRSNCSSVIDTWKKRAHDIGTTAESPSKMLGTASMRWQRSKLHTNSLKLLWHVVCSSMDSSVAQAHVNSCLLFTRSISADLQLLFVRLGFVEEDGILVNKLLSLSHSRISSSQLRVTAPGWEPPRSGTSARR